MHVVPRLVSSDPTCPLRSAVLAPLTVQGKRAGTLIAFYRSVGRPRSDELRVVGEAASLVSAQVELSVVREQEERLAQAELRALRARSLPISSTTPWPRWRVTSTPAPRRRASC